eukprot:6172304-Pleurochrysis_carterae.AAC.1
MAQTGDFAELAYVQARGRVTAARDFRSPSDGTFSPCTDEYREFLRSSCDCIGIHSSPKHPLQAQLVPPAEELRNRALRLCATRRSYGGPEEWRLLCQTASRLGLAGRFTGPWDTAIAVDSTGSSLGAGAAPNISKAVKAVPDAAKVALL